MAQSHNVHERSRSRQLRNWIALAVMLATTTALDLVALLRFGAAFLIFLGLFVVIQSSATVYFSRTFLPLAAAFESDAPLLARHYERAQALLLMTWSAVAVVGTAIILAQPNR